MGKPSSSSMISNKSETTMETVISRTKMNNTLNLLKTIVKNKKKQRRRTKQTFHKLLNRISVTDSSDNFTGNTALPLTPNINKKFHDNTENLIIINDNDVTPMTFANNSSTPIANRLIRNSANIAPCSPIIGQQKLDQMVLTNNLNVLQNSDRDLNYTTLINPDSYLTVDLTADSELEQTNNTVIDLVNVSENQDCTIVSVNDSDSTINCDSDVTIINDSNYTGIDNKMNKFAKGIAKMNSTEKGKLLHIIAKSVFNGCRVSRNIRDSLINIRESISRKTATVEDRYIKQVILGETPSRNSVGSNVYHPKDSKKTPSGLRMIVIDGSNVAMDHTRGREFSVKGLKICIDYFVRRGHSVKAFVPRFRCKYGKSTDPRLLDELERSGLVVYTPSREIQGRTITPYDDRYIIQCAAEFDGVIVTGDNYKDLANENPTWRNVINNRLLPFTWVDDMIMFPRDPLGRNGPTLEQFLRH